MHSLEITRQAHRDGEGWDKLMVVIRVVLVGPRVGARAEVNLPSRGGGTSHFSQLSPTAAVAMVWSIWLHHIRDGPSTGSLTLEWGKHFTQGPEN